MNLNHLTDNQLILDTRKLVVHELKCIVAILHYLREIETRKLFCDYKYPSMIDFVIHELGYSNPAAVRRIQSSRLLNDFPWIEPEIASGKLTLSVLHRVSIHFRKEKVQDEANKNKILKKLVGISYRECEKILFDLTPKPLPSESIRPVSVNHYQLKINITEETHKQLEDLKCFMGFHMIDNEYFSAIAKEAYQNVERKRFKLTDKGRESHSTGYRPSNHDRRVSYIFSEKVCENCGGLFYLQDDHREAYALGGSSHSGNLRLLCFHCNQRARIKAGL